MQAQASGQALSVKIIAGMLQVTVARLNQHPLGSQWLNQHPQGGGSVPSSSSGWGEIMVIDKLTCGRARARARARARGTARARARGTARARARLPLLK